jgi:glutaredoxin
MYTFLEKYSDEFSAPLPYVVELDQHPNGLELQTHLGEVTGRRTVPNVFVNGESIGGGDEIRMLEATGKVSETLLRKLAGKITVDGKNAL